MPGSSRGRPPSSRDRRQGSSRTAALHHASLFPSSPRWTHQLAWQTQPSSPVLHRQPPPFPHPPTHTEPYTSISASISQALLHQTAVIQPTNGSHANALRCVLTGNLKSTGSVCVCARACVRARAKEKSCEDTSNTLFAVSRLQSRSQVKDLPPTTFDTFKVT